MCSTLSKRVLAFFKNSKVFKNHVIGYIFHPLPDIRELMKEKFFQDNRSKQIANQATLLSEKQKVADRFIKSSNRTIALIEEELAPLEKRISVVTDQIDEDEGEIEKLEAERAHAKKMQVYLEKQDHSGKIRFCNENELKNNRAVVREKVRAPAIHEDRMGETTYYHHDTEVKKEHRQFINHYKDTCKQTTDRIFTIEPRMKEMKVEELELQSKINKLVHEVEELKNQQKQHVKTSTTPADGKVAVLSVKHQ